MLYKDYLLKNSDCPFCEGKDRKIRETENAYLTFALAPYHKHHLLAVPKKHVVSLLKLTPEESGEIESLTKIAVKIHKSLGYKSSSIMTRDGESVAKSVPHLHYHIIPNIHLGDIDHVGNERQILEKEEIEKLLIEIKEVLSKI